MSLRRRLLLGLLTVAAVLVVTNVTLSRRFESFLLDRVDAQLVDVASRPVFRDDRGPGRRGAVAQEETLSEYFIAVGNPASGTMRQLNSAFADVAVSPPKLVAGEISAHSRRPRAVATPFTVSAQSGDGRWRLVAVENGPVTAVIGVSLDEIAETLRRMRGVQAIGTIAVLATLGLVSWWVVRLGLHPLEDMAATADAIAAGDLSRRVAHPGERTEAGRLGIAFNSMVSRIQDAFAEREASEQRVRRFAADASHELRTPLTSILGYAELWRAGGLRDENELGDALARVEQEGRRMAALVEDLLLLARLDERRPSAVEPVRLDTLAADAVRDAGAVEPERPISVSVDPGGVTVLGDEGQLRQVVGNLLANARVHTPPTATVRVRVALAGGTAAGVGAGAGTRAVIEVADDGPGMTAEVAAHVFDRFFRADPSRGRQVAGGSGLGLAIVHAIVSGHGGSVSVDSGPGRGSRFVVELPAVVDAAVAR